jgi:hypothetical protein
MKGSFIMKERPVWMIGRYPFSIPKHILVFVQGVFRHQQNPKSYLVARNDCTGITAILLLSVIY